MDGHSFPRYEQFPKLKKKKNSGIQLEARAAYCEISTGSRVTQPALAAGATVAMELPLQACGIRREVYFGAKVFKTSV